MTLERLLFYAQSFHLVLKGTSLFSDEIVACANGPVVASVWARYGHFGTQPIERAKAAPPPLDGETETFLRDILILFAAFTAAQLSYATHLEDPWREARLGADRDDSPVMPRERLGQYYAGLMVEGETMLLRQALFDSVPQPRWGWFYIAGIYARMMRQHPFFVWGLSVLGPATNPDKLTSRSVEWPEDSAWAVKPLLTDAEIKALLRPASGGRRRRDH
jgi:hypothetical protein